MGDPKYPRKLWRKPKRPLNYELKMEELKTLGTFGLKTKRELWKARTELSRVRKQARSLLALRQEVRQEKEPILMRSLTRIGLVNENSTLDDVLNLKVIDLLSRRLQTVVLKKFNFKTPYQARQAVVHGHVLIGDRVVNIPSYVVSVDEEKNIRIKSDSSLNDLISKLEKESVQKVTDEAESNEQPTETKAENAEVKQVENTSNEQPTETKAENAEVKQVEKTSTEQSQD